MTPDAPYIFAHVSGNLNPVNLPGSAGDGPDDVVHPAPGDSDGRNRSVRGGIVDGPLAMDNAVSLTAAQSKGLTSLVAGRADS